MEQLQIQLCLTRPPHIWLNICAFSHILETLLSYDFATDPI
jgi:hypothetical protein